MRDSQSRHRGSNPLRAATFLNSETLFRTPGIPPKVPLDSRVRASQSRQRGFEALTDVMIYVLYLAHGAGIDLSEAIKSKTTLNAVKYPAEKCWDSNKKCNEL